VATLFGSGTASYRRSLLWATVTTALGSVTALFVARGLLAAFSGKGLVPPEIVATPSFPTAVALAAGLTVLLASRFGFPISTTHALIGGLVGAGLVTSPDGINTSKLLSGFLLPLLTSPVIAVGLAFGLYPPLRFLRQQMKVTQETCICVEERVVGVVPGTPGMMAAAESLRLPTLVMDDRVRCHVRYRGSVLGVSARSLLDNAHYLSAGAVSFARGLNDTPKIAALLLVGQAISPELAIVGVGFVIATGGLLASRRVAEVMSHKVTDMNPGQGFAANIVTSFLVIVASRFGMPVSTTHVSGGSLFGIGAVTRQAHWDTIRTILLAWAVTLPLAGVLGAGFAVLVPLIF